MLFLRNCEYSRLNCSHDDLQPRMNSRTSAWWNSQGCPIKFKEMSPTHTEEMYRYVSSDHNASKDSYMNEDEAASDTGSAA